MVIEKKFQSLDQQIIMLAHRYGRSPFIPAFFTLAAAVHGGSQNTDSYCLHVYLI